MSRFSAIHDEPTDATLLRRARNGSDQAFRLLVERYEDQVAATVIGMLGPGPTADEIGQRVFVRFYEALDQFREEASLGTYLTRIAMNLSLNETRRQKRWYRRFVSRDGREALPEPPVPGEGAAERREVQDLVHQALGQLSPKYRAVVVLRLIEGRSTRETAGVLDVPEGTVLSRLARAKGKLKDILAPYFEDQPTEE